MDELPICRRLDERAEREAMVSRAMADIKTARNRAAGDEHSNYAGLTTDQTLSAQAAALIRAQHEALEAAKEWLEGWASAEPYLSTITAAIKQAREA